MERTSIMKDTMDIRIIEAQICVPCPVWLQRRMLSNLDKATKSKINKDRAKKAERLLNAINGESKSISSKVQDKQVISTRPMDIRKPVPRLSHTTVSRARRFVKKVLGTCVAAISAFVKQLRIFQPAHGR